jgi:HEAT repeat protein
MTSERLFTLLELHANGGVLPDHNHFLLQATGLLEQHPELCAKMVELFQRPSLDTRGRALVLDLLAGTGTPQAQAALVQALSTKEARGDASYHMLLSRLSLVSEPTVDTVRFAERTYGATEGDLHVSSAYVLGATAGALYRQEQSPEALAAVRRLASDLGEARTPSEQSHLLLGLGNAGVAEQTPLIARHAGSPSAEVRRAAAKALRKIQTPEAASTLLSLVSDAEAPVQAAAMDSLGRRPLDPSTLVRLRDVALAGGMKAENYHPLVSLVAPYLQTEPAVRDLLEFLLTQDVPDRQIRSRIRGLLET